MTQMEQIIQGAGASAQLLADFRALAEATTMDGAPRHAPRHTRLHMATLPHRSIQRCSCLGGDDHH